VFADEQGFPANTEIDEYDSPGLAVHLLLRLVPSQLAVGTVRIVPPKLKIGRLCVLPEYRKYGFGKDLMLRSHEIISANLVKRGDKQGQIVLHAQIPVVAFYGKLGYTPVGDTFDEDGAPHQTMVLTLEPASAHHL